MQDDNVDGHAAPGPGEEPTHQRRASGDAKKRFIVIWVTVFSSVGLLLSAVVLLNPNNVLGNVVMRLTEDTEYAPGYSERAFRGVDIGDTEASVRMALGAPLRETGVEPYMRWLYASEPSPEFEADGSYPDLRFSFTTIDFEEDGTFTNAFGQVSHGSSGGILGISTSSSFGDGVNTLSLTRAEIDKLKAARATVMEISARFGQPDAKFESRVVKWLYYSRSPESKNYRQRFIGIDRSGRVCRKRIRFYWD